MKRIFDCMTGNGVEMAGHKIAVSTGESVAVPIMETCKPYLAKEHVARGIGEDWIRA